VSDVVVDALAAARVTRLVTTDTFPPIRMAREWFLDKVDPGKVRDVNGAEPPALAELITCNWCTGVWVAFGVVAARRAVPALWGPVAEALAVAMVVGQVAGWSQQEGDVKDLTRALGVGASAIAGAIRERNEGR
jgi:hypothetical protein